MVMRDRLADRPPRSLADMPGGWLSDATDEIARDWIVELVGGRPLQQLAGLDLATLSADAPMLCRAVVAAVRADDALAALAPAGPDGPLIARACRAAAGADPRGGEPAAATEVLAAVEALRRVVWATALALRGRADADQIAALSDRLAHVCATVAATAVALGAADAAPALVIHDTRAGDRAGNGLVADDRAADAGVSGAAGLAGDDDEWDARLELAVSAQPVGAVLLVDVDGHERLIAADGGPALTRAEQAIKRRLREEATIVRERLGRYWIVSGAETAQEATRLAWRLADAVGGGAGHLGVPLTASVGIALYRADKAGALADDLYERADEAMLSARAAGAGVQSR
jgi:GGDEF domain-containing protein